MTQEAPTQHFYENKTCEGGLNLTLPFFTDTVFEQEHVLEMFSITTIAFNSLMKLRAKIPHPDGFTLFEMAIDGIIMRAVHDHICYVACHPDSQIDIDVFELEIRHKTFQTIGSLCKRMLVNIDGLNINYEPASPFMFEFLNQRIAAIKKRLENPALDEVQADFYRGQIMKCQLKLAEYDKFLKEQETPE